MALERHIAQLGEQSEILATMDVGKLWDRMLGEFLGEWERLNRQGLSADAMDRAMVGFMDDLSDKPIADLARQSSSVAYNQGRAAEILSAHVDRGVEFVVRSEILDSATCEACANLDSAVIEVGTPDFDEYMPPAKCEGGRNCRCFYVAIRGDAVA